jgi:membrane protease YdiL (CAAX protease family)
MLPETGRLFTSLVTSQIAIFSGGESVLSPAARLFLQSALMTAPFVVLALPALCTGQRHSLAAIAALAFLYSLVEYLPVVWPPARLFGGEWNWTGKTYGIAVSLIAVGALARSRIFSPNVDFGLTFAQAPATMRAILLGVVPFLALIGVVNRASGFMPQRPDLETWLFQSTMPGLDEELFFRGLMFALLDRIFPTIRFNALGARIGYGALATALAFGACHGVSLGRDATVHFYWMPAVFSGAIGFFLSWLRARTGSLLLPVITHNGVDIVGFLVAALR